MEPTWQTSADFDFQLALGDGDTLTRATSGLWPDGGYWFEDQLDLAGPLTAPVITCTVWLLELHTLTAGALTFHSGAAVRHPRAATFAVFYPPFTLTRPAYYGVNSRVLGVAGTATPPTDLPAQPVLFTPTAAHRPSSVAEVFALVRTGADCQPIAAYPDAEPLACAAKQLIDANYAVTPGIGRVAARLNVSHAHLTRQFKRAYGLSPSAYLHQLRQADAPLRLARGEPIVDVSLDVGYNDLSRFYAQFRKRTRTSPGACQTLVQPAGV